MSCQLNNEKVWSIKEKTTKSSITFRRNKPNFQKAKMNVNIYYIKEYQIFIPLAGQKNKPNSNPIKPCPERSRMGQSPKSQNERKLIYYRGLQKKR